MGFSLLERIASKLLNPDFSSKGPFPVVGLEAIESDTHSNQAAFDKFAGVVARIASQYGCRSEIQVETIPMFQEISSHAPIYSQQMITKQLVLLPTSGQSIGAFERSLQSISAAVTDSKNITDSMPLTQLAMLFRNSLEKVIIAKKHGHYTF